MFKRARIWVLAFIVVTASSFMLVSCDQTEYYTEEDLGLRKETLYDEASTSPAHGETTKMEPGESTRIERAFENAPPLIPHDTTGMLPLAQTENICIDCHMPEEAESQGATPIPDSHLVDLDTGKDLDGNLDGSRFNCMQCHVIQTNLSPAVENIFKGEFRDEKGRYRSNLLNILNEGVETE
jgi:cytochrome c-type protein NapB